MHPLIQHIRKITAHSNIPEEELLSFFETRSFRKKELLQEEDKRCLSYFFVIKGCIRLFFTDHNGAEQTLQFALENWWLTDLDAFRSGKNSAYSIQALETTEVLTLTAKNHTLLLEQMPLLEKYFRRIYERAYAATLLRVQMISRMPKNEFYELFASKYPDFIQRVPQKILASFLGFTPEYLSELRKKKIKKK
ncbi:Crp/Fnr family transcriptional regulator [Niabella drilacis]|uniref:cAMP-binding domain of CRP or a regulatory subunit of cAMP-dependent protein kinases n=1 Tax=Niabella drilacis (strain DSM 25811 / CCM 8410 / CCUG 62505 / LMG 26954 / E90) TaxID=1285928 RepID=A0A1G6HYQ5_NIADE|nr:Crp/Fnr family transcriptional regulator [Niabella drilacis]SDB99320.1 cAMP-binding domain of CRP or a regulatory subunit of cAMP-dependent protein kinases [Niabella drilacis]